MTLKSIPTSARGAEPLLGSTPAHSADSEIQQTTMRNIAMDITASNAVCADIQ